MKVILEFDSKTHFEQYEAGLRQEGRDKAEEKFKIVVGILHEMGERGAIVLEELRRRSS